MLSPCSLGRCPAALNPAAVLSAPVTVLCTYAGSCADCMLTSAAETVTICVTRM